jgi:hypothetical protein
VGGVDGVALSPDGCRFYYAPLSSRRLYSIATAVLADLSASEEAMSAAVRDEAAATTCAGRPICLSAYCWKARRRSTPSARRHQTPPIRFRRISDAPLRTPDGLPAAHAVEPTPPVTTYCWTDSNGVSHMTRCEMQDFELQSMSKPADPQWQDRQPHGGSTVITTVQPPHWNGTWHEDPKVQWIIPLKGTWFVEAMDGTRVELGPGDVSLGEDQNTRPDVQRHKGHLSGNVGDGAVTLMVIQLDMEATVGEPCHFQ